MIRFVAHQDSTVANGLVITVPGGTQSDDHHYEVVAWQAP